MADDADDALPNEADVQQMHTTLRSLGPHAGAGAGHPLRSPPCATCGSCFMKLSPMAAASWPAACWASPAEGGRSHPGRGRAVRDPAQVIRGPRRRVSGRPGPNTRWWPSGEWSGRSRSCARITTGSASHLARLERFGGHCTSSTDLPPGAPRWPGSPPANMATTAPAR